MGCLYTFGQMGYFHLKLLVTAHFSHIKKHYIDSEKNMMIIFLNKYIKRTILLFTMHYYENYCIKI